MKSLPEKKEKTISICHVEITPIDSMPRVWREAESAQNAGMDVTVIGQGLSCVKNGIRYIGFPDAGSRIKRMLFRSRDMIKAAVDTGADIIQFHSPEFMLSVPYLKKKNKKIIFDSHEFYGYQIETKDYIPQGIRHLVSKAYMAVEEYTCRRIECVLYPCTVERHNYFENRAKRSEKIENYAYPTKVPAKEQSSEKYVIHAGGLTHERGITALAEAIKLTDCKLLLCGMFSSEEYKKRILSISDNIIYLGLLSREELYKQYARSSIGIATLLPVGQYAKIDNMSTKVYEYMQCELPVIISNFPFWAEMNEKYKFGVTVNPEDPVEIAKAIQYIVDNPSLAQTMGKNGKAAVDTDFNWKAEEKKLLDIYTDIANS